MTSSTHAPDTLPCHRVVQPPPNRPSTETHRLSHHPRLGSQVVGPMLSALQRKGHGLSFVSTGERPPWRQEKACGLRYSTRLPLQNTGDTTKSMDPVVLPRYQSMKHGWLKSVELGIAWCVSGYPSDQTKRNELLMGSEINQLNHPKSSYDLLTGPLRCWICSFAV